MTVGLRGDIGNAARGQSRAPRHPPGPTPEPVTVPDTAALSLFLRLEAAAREAGDLTALRHLAANETRKLNRARQALVVEIDRNGKARVVAISSLATVNRQSEVVNGVEMLLARLGQDKGLADAAELRLPAYCDPDSALATSYPFPELAWLPFLDRSGRVFAGLLLARDTPWTADEIAVTLRLAGVYAHAWRELATAASFTPRRRPAAIAGLAASGLALLALLIPVPMSALAPVEIVAATPGIVASEMDGVVEALLVTPSARVEAGMPLVRLVDTAFRNKAEIASREVVVAEARVRQATILAFSDARSRHDLALAEAELALKKAELAYARDMLARSIVRAPISGIAVFADPKALVGRPVQTGERIMEIAEPSRVEARIDLAVADVVALAPRSPVRLFLDVDPLAPWSGEVVRSDYRAQPSQTDTLVFRAFASIAADGRPPPRIGLRGTAQVRGERTVLGLYLFRRPLSSLRQWIGL
ncbi:MAG: HlyD family efflux transporter periplasmic adaptor subunit [Hyphomicrobiaceae bacterium]